MGWHGRFKSSTNSAYSMYQCANIFQNRNIMYLFKKTQNKQMFSLQPLFSSLLFLKEKLCQKQYTLFIDKKRCRRLCSKIDKAFHTKNTLRSSIFIIINNKFRNSRKKKKETKMPCSSDLTPVGIQRGLGQSHLSTITLSFCKQWTKATQDVKFPRFEVQQREDVSQKTTSPFLLPPRFFSPPPKTRRSRWEAWQAMILHVFLNSQLSAFHFTKN